MRCQARANVADPVAPYPPDIATKAQAREHARNSKHPVFPSIQSKIPAMTKTTRRRFLARSIQGTAALLVPALLPGRVFAGEPRRPFGIQVYAVNQAFESDPAGTFKKLRQIGFTEVECYAGGNLSARE